MKLRHISFVAALFVGLSSPLLAAELKGRVVSAAGQMARVKIDSEVRPAVGDKVEFSFAIGGMTERASAGTGIVEVIRKDGSVDVHVLPMYLVLEGYSATIKTNPVAQSNSTRRESSPRTETTSRIRPSRPTVDEGESDFPPSRRRPNVTEGTPDSGSTSSRTGMRRPTVEEGQNDFAPRGRRPNVSEGTPDTRTGGETGFIDESSRRPRGETQPSSYLRGDDRYLMGNGGYILSIAASRDGKRLVSISQDVVGGENVTAILWDAVSGRPIRTMHPHGRLAGHVTFSGVGGHALYIDADGKVRSLDLNTGREATLAQLKLRGDETARFESVLFSADETRAIAAVSSIDARRVNGDIHPDSIRVFAIRSGEELCSLQGIEGRISGLTLSQDGKRILAADNNTWLCVWDAETGRAISRVQAPAFTKIAFSKSGPIAALASVAATEHPAINDGIEITRIDGPKANPNIPKEAYGFLNARPTSSAVIRIVNVQTGRDLRTFDRPSMGDCDVALSADSRTLAVGDEKSVRVWDVDTRTLKKDFHVDGGWCEHMQFFPDGRTLAAIVKGTSVRLQTISEFREGIQER
jgi:WD40 repeat protein